MLKYFGNHLSVFKGIILLLPFVLYGITIGYDFVLDDTVVIVDNAFVKKGWSGISDILFSEGFEGYFGEKRSLVAGSRYRPLSLIMFAVEYSVIGAKPWLGHLINIFLYGFIGLLILRLAQFIIPHKEGWMSFGFIWAVLFILHPIHSEVVCNIKGRDEILALLFALWSLKSAFHYSQEGKSRSLFWTCLFFFLALLGKENATPFIALIPLSLWMFANSTKRQLIIVFGSLLITFFAYLMLRFTAVGYLIPKELATPGDLMNNPFVEMTTSQKYATISNTMFQYWRLLLVPYPLTHDYYPYQVPITNWTAINAWLGLVLNVGLGLTSLFFIKKYKVFSWGILFYLGTLFLVSNIPFSIGTMMNERFVFMPSLGILAIASYYALRFLQPYSKSWIPNIVLGATAVLMMTATLIRVPAWKDGESLNKAASKASTNSARMNLFLGTDYYNKALSVKDLNEKTQLLQASEELMDMAIRIYPDYGAAYNMKAGVCAEFFNTNRNIEKLTQCFTDIASVKPNTRFVQEYLVYIDDLGTYQSHMYQFYIYIGYERLLKANGDIAQSIRYLRRAEKISASKEVLTKLYEAYDQLVKQLKTKPSKDYTVQDISYERDRLKSRILQLE